MDGIQVSNCTTELTGPTITLGLATPLGVASHAMLFSMLTNSYI